MPRVAAPLNGQPDNKRATLRQTAKELAFSGLLYHALRRMVFRRL